MKPDLWGPLAAELGVPWRSAEAMHWALGKDDMAHRAGVNPFSMSAPTSQTFAAAPILHAHSPLSFGQVPEPGLAPSVAYPHSSIGTGVVAGPAPLPSPGSLVPREQSVDPAGTAARLSPHQHLLSQQHLPFPRTSSAAAYRRPSDPGLSSTAFGRPLRQAPASAPGSVAGSIAGTEASSETLPAFGSGAGGPMGARSGSIQGREGSLPSLAEVVGGVPAHAGSMYAASMGGVPIERRSEVPTRDEETREEGRGENEAMQQTVGRDETPSVRSQTSNGHVVAEAVKEDSRESESMHVDESKE